MIDLVIISKKSLIKGVFFYGVGKYTPAEHR